MVAIVSYVKDGRSTVSALRRWSLDRETEVEYGHAQFAYQSTGRPHFAMFGISRTSCPQSNEGWPLRTQIAVVLRCKQKLHFPSQFDLDLDLDLDVKLSSAIVTLIQRTQDDWRQHFGGGARGASYCIVMWSYGASGRTPSSAPPCRSIDSILLIRISHGTIRSLIFYVGAPWRQKALRKQLQAGVM